MKLTSLILCGVAAIALAPAMAYAQAAVPTPGQDQDDQSATGLEDIVVTARRVEERAQDIPVAVTAFSGANLVQQQIREVRDLSSKAPNLVINESQGERQAVTFVIRGQGAANILLTTDASVGFYVDGVNVPRTLGARNALVDIQRAEILRGPQGTLYGRNTTGGAVSVYTQDPKQELGGQIVASAGDYGAFSGMGILNVPLTENIGLRLLAQHSEHAGYGRQANGRETQDENSTYFRAKLKGDFGRLRAVLGADYSESQAGGATQKLQALLPATATLPLGRGLTQEVALALGYGNNQAGWDRAIAYIQANSLGGNPYRIGTTSPQESLFHGFGTSLNLDYEINDKLALRSITGYRNFNRVNRQELSGTLDAFTNLQTAEDDFWSQELQLLGNWGPVRFVTGLYYSKEDGVERSFSRSTFRLNNSRETVFDADVTSESKAVFAQGTWEFLPKWSLTLGARYTEETKSMVTRNRLQTPTTTTCVVPVALRDDAVSCQGSLSSTFSDPSWLASVDYKITDDVLIYGKVARGFRAGGQNFRGTTAPAFVPFKPEYATEYELGVKSELWNRVRLNVAAFFTDYEDVQRSITLLVNGATSTPFTNAATATVKGVEGEIEWRVSRGFTLNASAGYIDASYDDFVDFTGDRTGEDWPAPDFTGAVSGRYVWPTQMGDLALQANYVYTGEQNLYPQSVVGRQYVIQEAYGLLNTRLSLSLDQFDAEIAIYGHNLTDETYAAAAVAIDGSGFATKIMGEPRTVGVEFRKRFGGG